MADPPKPPARTDSSRLRQRRYRQRKRQAGEVEVTVFLTHATVAQIDARTTAAKDRGAVIDEAIAATQPAPRDEDI